MGNGRAESIGFLLGTLTIPAIGLALLIVGLVLRAKQNTTNPIGGMPPQWPPYPQQGVQPPGQPPQGNYPWQGQYPPQTGYPQQPGYPPQAGYPPQPGYPPQAGYPQQAGPNQPWPGHYPPAPPRRSNTPTVLIVIGAVILALSILGVLGRAGQAAQDQRHASLGSCNVETSVHLEAGPHTL